MAESRLPAESRDSRRKPFGLETGFHIMLSVSPNKEDRACRERMYLSGWTVVASSRIVSILSAKREIPIPIVIYDCDVSLGSCITMLEPISPLPEWGMALVERMVETYREFSLWPHPSVLMYSRNTS
jgi:hypothetical protein